MLYKSTLHAKYNSSCDPNRWLKYAHEWIPQYSYRGNLSDLPRGQKQHVKIY